MLPRMDDDLKVQSLSTLSDTGDDLVDDKQIRAFMSAIDIVEHRSSFSDSAQDIWDEVQVEKWRFVRPLGQGGFGHVHLEERIFQRFPIGHSGTQFRAVKIISDRNGSLKTRRYLSEILGMAKFSKLGVSFVQLFAWFQLGTDIGIAMEWAPYGDLQDCVQIALPESEAKEIMRQVTQAVVIMHQKRFLHRDLKPKNVFVFRKRPEAPEWRVKLGDFGVSKRVHLADDTTSWHTSIDADCSAPEVLGLLSDEFTEESSYADPVDMWSLGYLTYWLLTRQYPVSRFELPRLCRTMTPISLGAVAEIGVSENALEFMGRLLQLKPSNRMVAMEAFQHPWLTSVSRKVLDPQVESAASSFDQESLKDSTPAVAAPGYRGSSSASSPRIATSMDQETVSETTTESLKKSPESHNAMPGESIENHNATATELLGKRNRMLENLDVIPRERGRLEESKTAGKSDPLKIEVDHFTNSGHNYSQNPLDSQAEDLDEEIYKNIGKKSQQNLQPFASAKQQQATMGQELTEEDKNVQPLSPAERAWYRTHFDKNDRERMHKLQNIPRQIYTDDLKNFSRKLQLRTPLPKDVVENFGSNTAWQEPLCKKERQIWMDDLKKFSQTLKLRTSVPIGLMQIANYDRALQEAIRRESHDDSVSNTVKEVTLGPVQHSVLVGQKTQTTGSKSKSKIHTKDVQITLVEPKTSSTANLMQNAFTNGVLSDNQKQYRRESDRLQQHRDDK